MGTPSPGTGPAAVIAAAIVCSVIAAAIIRALLHLIEIIALVMLGICAIAIVMVIAAAIIEHRQDRREQAAAARPVPGTDEWLTQATETLVAEITRAQQAYRRNSPDA